MSESEGLRGARWAVEAVVERNAVEAFGGCVLERPSRRGPASAPFRDVSPLHGVRAAWHARGVTEDRARYYAGAARAQGVSWEEIGAALKLTAEVAAGGRALGQVAFALIAEGREPGMPSRWPGWVAYLHWRCSRCGGWVTDRGPGGGSPASTETGHAPGCQRHRREISDYRAGEGR